MFEKLKKFLSFFSFSLPEIEVIEGSVERVIVIKRPLDSDIVKYFIKTKQNIIEIEDEYHDFARFKNGDYVSIRGSKINAIKLMK